MQSIRRLPLIFTVLLSLLASACLRGIEPPPPPFRIAPYGPGLEISRNGTLVTLEDDQGEALGRLRVASHSLRTQQTNATPIGRIRVTADGWAFTNRAGSDVCTLSNQSLQANCVDDLHWTARPTTLGIEIVDANGGVDHVPLRDEPVSIRSAGQLWSPHAYALIHRAFDPQFEDQVAFAAYSLLSWGLRTVDLSALPAPTPQDVNEIEHSGGELGTSVEEKIDSAEPVRTPSEKHIEPEGEARPTEEDAPAAP